MANPKKRGNGEGSIFKNVRNGQQVGWRGQMTIGRTDKGNLKYKNFYGKSKKEVQAKMDEYKRQMLISIPIEREMTVANWFFTWLFDYRKQDLKPKSFQRYHGIYKNYISESELGNIKLQDLRTTHLQRYYRSLLDDKVTPTTIKQINTNLKTCLGEAEKQGYIQKNWCKLVTLPKIDNDKEVKVLTKEEQQRFLEAIKGHELEMLFTTALGTGLRIGEILGLKWSDIDFKANELHVNRSIQRVAIYENDEVVGYEVIEQTPKTKNSIRTIPVPNNIINKLKAYKKSQLENILLLGEAYNNRNYISPKIK